VLVLKVIEGWIKECGEQWWGEALVKNTVGHDTKMVQAQMISIALLHSIIIIIIITFRSCRVDLKS